ncbi:MAG: hypothetical protein N4A33_10915 [Bacteriovoracaceae bacterium]|jgi:translation initiation factor 2B subunit (eIF-2B alpha/beta/delta family)|nr:hypothetical protein [Bacteriovoracaceae bacterium]
MRKTNTGRRVALTIEATKYLEESINELTQNKKYIKVTEAKLVSKALVLYFQRYFKKDKKELENIFLDKKAYLKEIIQNSQSDEELINSVKKYIGKQHRKRDSQVNAI